MQQYDADDDDDDDIVVVFAGRCDIYGDVPSRPIQKKEARYIRSYRPPGEEEKTKQRRRR